MTRDITNDVVTEITAGRLRWARLLKLAFDSGDLNLWSGLGSLDWNSESWAGAGDLISVSAIAESQKTVATGARFTLVGAPAALISIALQTDYHNRAITLRLALLNTSTRAVIADPFVEFAGRMDVMRIIDDPAEPTIEVTAEHNLAFLRRPSVRRYTDEDQRIDYPSDRGFEFVAALQNRDLPFGRGV